MALEGFVFSDEFGEVGLGDGGFLELGELAELFLFLGAGFGTLEDLVAGFYVFLPAFFVVLHCLADEALQLLFLLFLVEFGELTVLDIPLDNSNAFLRRHQRPLLYRPQILLTPHPHSLLPLFPLTHHPLRLQMPQKLPDLHHHIISTPRQLPLLLLHNLHHLLFLGILPLLIVFLRAFGSLLLLVSFLQLD